MSKLAFATLLLTLAVQGVAQDKKSVSAKKPEASAPVIYRIDTATSTIDWKGTKKIGSSHNGQVKIQSGELSIENNSIKGGQIVVDMKTISNLDLKDQENNKKLVGHLSSPDFFNVAKFPTSVFKITSATAGKTKETLLIKGDFTMVGQTQSVEVPATVTFSNDGATGEATIKIDRTRWGLKYGSGNFFKELAGDKIINDEFELTFKLSAKK
jgi:polyisoprenoid-binding protein YceI